MALNVALLTESFELVVSRNPSLTARFYEHLFAKYPAAQAMFHRKPLASQEKMLSEALAAVIGHLEDAPWLSATLGALGEKHQGYGVSSEMYGWVGDALMTTLREVAGRDWTDAHEQAWTDAFGAIVSLMDPARKRAA